MTTPPWSAVIVVILLWTASAVNIGIALYRRSVLGDWPAWANNTRIALEVGNVVLTTVILAVLSSLTMISPEALSRLVSTSPTVCRGSSLNESHLQSVVAQDDSVTLFSWLSFNWVNPFITYGNSKELEPEDLPSMSLTQQTAVVFDAFNQLKSSSLLRKLFVANRTDLAIDAGLTLVSVLFSYAGPYFLKNIL